MTLKRDRLKILYPLGLSVAAARAASRANRPAHHDYYLIARLSGECLRRTAYRRPAAPSLATRGELAGVLAAPPIGAKLIYQLHAMEGMARQPVHVVDSRWSCDRLLQRGSTNVMLARRDGTAWEIFAPAKLNLYLEVLGRRTDGFHELETVMAPVRIFDYLRWTPAPTFSFGCSSIAGYPPSSKLPHDQQNLALRAVLRLAETLNVEPRGKFTLRKTIPAGAGLGGGSSDAAAALLLARAAWDLPVADETVGRLANELGSDVPFFLAGQAATCRGRGEQITPIDHFPALPLVVVYPSTHLATSDVFANLTAPAYDAKATGRRTHRGDRWLGDLRTGRWSQFAEGMRNELVPAAERLAPMIARVLAAMKRLGVAGATMTGSGSACVAICRSMRHARQVAGVLAGRRLGSVWATSTCH